jgi:ParB family chromosome partitioning protein
MNELIPFDEARKELAEIDNIPDALDWANKASVLQDYLEKSGGDLAESNRYWALSKECHFKIVQLLDAGRARGEIAKQGDNRFSRGSAPDPLSLDDLGLTKRRANCIRKDTTKANIDMLWEWTDEQTAEGNEATTAGWWRHIHGAHVGKNSGQDEWYTPPKYIDAARDVMGNIDLDPASSSGANDMVQADEYYTILDDGLTHGWRGKVWMNPPYSQPLINDFCEKFAIDYRQGFITEGCVLVNNATDTGWYHALLEHAAAVCFIKGRVKFIDENGEATGAPLQGQTVLYFGDSVDDFGQRFNEFGRVLFNDTWQNIQQRQGAAD